MINEKSQSLILVLVFFGSGLLVARNNSQIEPELINYVLAAVIPVLSLFTVACFFSVFDKLKK